MYDIGNVISELTRVYVVLKNHDGPMEVDDIAKILGNVKSNNIDAAINYLEQTGLIITGSKGVQYVPQLSEDQYNKLMKNTKKLE